MRIVHLLYASCLVLLFFVAGQTAMAQTSRAGYSYPLGKSAEGNPEVKGGAMINPGMGLRLNFTTQNALIFSLGWRYQEIRSHYTYYYWGGPIYDNGYDRTDFYRRIAIRLGFVFN